MRSLLIMLLLFLFVCGCGKVKDIRREDNTRDTGAKKTISQEGTEDEIVCGISGEATIDPEVWKDYLEKNLALDSAALDTIPAGTYTVFVQFVINDKGKISDVSVLKDPGYGLGQRTMKVISDYKDRWKPSEIQGRTKEYCTQLVTFIVEEEVEECEGNLSAGITL